MGNSGKYFMLRSMVLMKTGNHLEKNVEIEKGNATKVYRYGIRSMNLGFRGPGDVLKWLERLDKKTD
ncbi:MAG: hypothetical protein K6U74_12160 [Firmicutes bacterium]|nr:hypothetical protein [Bacillota bacterium]